MKEELLHYIWQYQVFDKKILVSRTGKPLKVFFAGFPNQNQGPDFLSAKIKIDEEIHYGHVEIHKIEDEWYYHNHHKNPIYKSVILHVIWDSIPSKHPPIDLPTLILSPRVDPSVLVRHQELMNSTSPIPCAKHLVNVGARNWQQALKQASIVRFDKKHDLIYNLHKKNNHDSDITSYQLLARSFGFSSNSSAFLTLSEKAPYNIIQKKWNDLPFLEALLFGQAGFLDNCQAKGKYISNLQQMHRYLQQKYKLPAPMSKTAWHFSRLRPANFPTVRIAQMARFLYKKQDLFSFLLNTPHQKLITQLSRYPSRYWKSHYTFGKYTTKTIPPMGLKSINSILINTTIALLISYGRIRQQNFYVERAIDILRQMPAEQNSITKHWTQRGMTIKNAFESQASLALFKNFCTPQKCLTCKIGIHLLQRETNSPQKISHIKSE